MGNEADLQYLLRIITTLDDKGLREVKNQLRDVSAAHRGLAPEVAKTTRAHSQLGDEFHRVHLGGRAVSFMLHSLKEVAQGNVMAIAHLARGFQFLTRVMAGTGWVAVAITAVTALASAWTLFGGDSTKAGDKAKKAAEKAKDEVEAMRALVVTATAQTKALFDQLAAGYDKAGAAAEASIARLKELLAVETASRIEAMRGRTDLPPEKREREIARLQGASEAEMARLDEQALKEKANIASTKAHAMITQRQQVEADAAKVQKAYVTEGMAWGDVNKRRRDRGEKEQTPEEALKEAQDARKAQNEAWLALKEAESALARANELKKQYPAAAWGSLGLGAAAMGVLTVLEIAARSKLRSADVRVAGAEAWESDAARAKMAKDAYTAMYGTGRDKEGKPTGQLALARSPETIDREQAMLREAEDAKRKAANATIARQTAEAKEQRELQEARTKATRDEERQRLSIRKTDLERGLKMPGVSPETKMRYQEELAAIKMRELNIGHEEPIATPGFNLKLNRPMINGKPGRPFYTRVRSGTQTQTRDAESPETRRGIAAQQNQIASDAALQIIKDNGLDAGKTLQQIAAIFQKLVSDIQTLQQQMSRLRTK